MNNNLERTERILGSFDNLQKAAAPDFFYTRLTGRMQQEADMPRSWILRPAFISAALGLLLLLNIFSFLEMRDKPARAGASHSHTEKPAGIESFVRAYNMNTQSLYE